jgi:4-hydroxythreonine-4-phosphate dehydrogenase
VKDWNLNGIQQVEQASHKMTNVITCFSDTIPLPAPDATDRAEGEASPASGPASQPAADIQPGKVTPEAGLAAFACLTRAVEDLKAGKLHGLVTAPINKHNIQSEAFTFPGHTEYLAHAFGVSDNLMFMVSDILKVGVVTGHVPISRVKQGIHKGAIAQKLEMMTKSLKQDFGIRRPKIAVLGLNPHAGERGLLGTEENDIITPLINELRQKGQLIYGPFPADGFFGTRAYRKYDAVLAMYHDQGLIPFKSIAFDEGVNFTAGLPAVRTSPDHGTAYDIAGKGVADETSMVQAIYTACDVARRRKEYQELDANALKK